MNRSNALIASARVAFIQISCNMPLAARLSRLQKSVRANVRLHSAVREMSRSKWGMHFCAGYRELVVGRQEIADQVPGKALAQEPPDHLAAASFVDVVERGLRVGHRPQPVVAPV